MKRVFLAGTLIVLAATVVLGETGVKKKRPLPYEFGTVVINNYSEKAALPPVAFEHWLHRAKFTCRVCHVDLAFAMKAGATNIRAADNIKGYYCGTCHNGRMAAGDRKVFESCSTSTAKTDMKSCERCHSIGRNPRKDYDFNAFTSRLPKERFGNGVDWEKAEADGLIKPIDFVEGVSIKRESLAVQKDFALAPALEGMPDIIFSHKRHTVSNGCELCHPEIFLGVKKGMTKYTMVEIFEGKYCGVCHGSVAFPLLDCQRCHKKQV